MIKVLYHSFEQAPSLNKMKELALILPQQFHKSIFRYFKEEDKYKSLIGKLMLQQFLHEKGFSDQKFLDWQTNDYGKPSITNFPSFNISHSHGMIVCAIASQPHTILGIDTEEVRFVEIEYFNSCFNENEWQEIQEATDRLKTFYRFWTMKESFIKADGRGLTLAPIHVITDGLKANELGKSEKWHFHPLELHPNYKTHVCLSEQEAEIVANKFKV